MTHAWDETWRRLLAWTSGQGPSERLAAQILFAEGYQNVDPSHPLGGRDGGKDAMARKDGLAWAMAAYFPRDQQSFTDIKVKFLDDVAKARAAGADAVAFVTNQELRLGQRKELADAAGCPVDLLHLERLTALLDRPDMHPVRAQYLGIPVDAAAPEAPVPTWHDFLARAPRTPGGPEHWMLHDGFLVLRVLALPAPPARHPDAATPKALLERAASQAAAVARNWPTSVSLLARELADSLQADGPHRWTAGRMVSDPERLVQRERAAVAFDTSTGALAIERTWLTTKGEDQEPLAYHAAREPEVVAELLVALRLAGELLMPYGVPVDVAVYIGAVGDEGGRLVSSERAVSGPRFGPPVARAGSPRAEVPGRHLDIARVQIDQLLDPFSAARELAGPWLAGFRSDDLFALLADG